MVYISLLCKTWISPGFIFKHLYEYVDENEYGYNMFSISSRVDVENRFANTLPFALKYSLLQIVLCYGI